jgi:outer membrane protein assembly factor BamB
MKLDLTDGSTEWMFRTDPTEQFKYCFGGSAGGPGLAPGSDCRTNAECNSNWCTTKTNQYHDFGFINGPHYVNAQTTLGGTRPLIVSASKNGTVYALNAADGTIAWATSVLPAPISPTFAGYGLFNGALAYMNGKFYGALYQFSPAFSPAPEHLQAFSEVDGSVVWTDEIGISWSSVGAASGTVYTGTQASRSLYAYNGETGARLTTMTLPASSAAEPVVDGDMLFVGYGIDSAGGVRAYRILP